MVSRLLSLSLIEIRATSEKFAKLTGCVRVEANVAGPASDQAKAIPYAGHPHTTGWSRGCTSIWTDDLNRFTFKPFKLCVIHWIRVRVWHAQSRLALENVNNS